MARLPRNVIAGLPVHVIQRGNNRQNVFFSSCDYRRYLGSMGSDSIENRSQMKDKARQRAVSALSVTPQSTLRFTEVDPGTRTASFGAGEPMNRTDDELGRTRPSGKPGRRAASYATVPTEVH